MKINGEIWVVAEQRQGKLIRITLELLGRALSLAAETEADVGVVIMGNKTDSLCRELAQKGADRLYCVENDSLEHFNPELYSRIVSELAREYKPRIILLGATVQGSAVSPAVAAKLGSGLTAHCCEVSLAKQGRLLQVVPSLEGYYVFVSHQYPEMATISPGVLPLLSLEKAGKGEIVQKELSSLSGYQDVKTKVISLKKSEKPAVSLEDAEVIVAGGAGVGSDGWAMLHELAEVLGGVVGATRPAVDEGWIDHERLIGQSGKSVSPRLYIAVGISGDPLHLSGLREPEMFFAINKNPKATIFQFADYGVVADYKKILPLLIETAGRKL
ncbi:MAG: electron transfer flavoprotein subunit alpha/FixB family protein [Bacillota bacterium]